MMLKENKCLPCEAGVKPLTVDEVKKILPDLQAWEVTADGKKLQKTFSFKNYYQTVAFVNAIAWMAHQENHHPDIVLSYNKCTVEYMTHAIDGLSKNDFICAAKVDAIL